MLKNFATATGLLLSLFLLSNCAGEPDIEDKQSAYEIEQRVEELIDGMELADKVGEMTQLAIDVLSEGEPYSLKEPHQLDTAKLREVLVDLRVGSILNVGGHAYTRKHWKEIITTIQRYATEEKPSGIPVLYGIDAVHGANYTQGATLFPQQIGLAATWNPDHALETGRITAYETRASYIPWAFAPVLDIGRDPRWPRLWETFGEDVYLASEMGEAMVTGYQGEDIGNPYQVASCMKHFLGYSVTLTGKDRTQAWIPDRQLYEYFTPTFERAIEAGASTVMICSGEINGIPVHADKRILTDLLREKLGFEGLAVSDWEDIKYLVSRHKVARNHKEAIKMAINAGIDMSMVPMDTEFPVLLQELVEEGEVPMQRIDEAVRRILRLKFRLGLFEQPVPADSVDYSRFASEAHRKAALAAAEESITLLKNTNAMLPLDQNVSMLVTGPAANSINHLNGGWTGVWQGDDPAYVDQSKPTIMQALRSRLGADRVSYERGTRIDSSSVLSLARASRAAQQADVAIVCIGESTYTEKPGDLDEMDLPRAQVQLVEAIAATNTPIVLVLVEGRPRIIREIEPLAEAIVHAYLPGNEGGRAIAKVLTGEVNPSGRLPYTYPRYSNSLLTYDHKGTDAIDREFGTTAYDPQYPFGHGLSYTTFEYSDLELSQKSMTEGESIEVAFTVRNTGKRKGKEVVQLYLRDEVASITPAVRRLKGFAKIELASGAEQQLTFTLTEKDLAFIGQDLKPTVEPGQFTVMLGGMEASFSFEESIKF